MFSISVGKYSARPKEGEILCGVQFCLSVLGNLVHIHTHPHTHIHMHGSMRRNWWRALNNTTLCWSCVGDIPLERCFLYWTDTVVSRRVLLLFGAKSSESWILVFDSQQMHSIFLNSKELDKVVPYPPAVLGSGTALGGRSRRHPKALSSVLITWGASTV